MNRDRSIVALGVAAWIGATLAWPVPRGLGVLLVLAALAARKPVALVVGVALLASGLGAAAHAGLVPVPRHAFDGEAVLVADPVDLRGRAVRVDVRAEGRRYEAVAQGAAARALGRRAAGDVVLVHGTVSPRRPGARWLEVRHVVGRLDIESVGEWRAGSPSARVANAVRARLDAGADALPSGQRPLYRGLVYGDDRGQAPTTVDDLRAAGLGHLLAVSGQNVAVVLGAARPLLERCRYRVRFPLVVTFLVLLVLVTRAEPSILRAACMAGVVALADALGRSASSVRVLVLAVTALVLADPLLVGSVGFQLSAAATLGIVVLAAPIARRLPLPAGAAEAVGVMLAAQLAVAPLVILVFGGLPVAALPANLLAGPAAAPVMVWGATAGVVAGLLGGPAATLLQLPPRVLLGWIELVGATAGRVPLGELRIVHLVALAAVGAVSHVGRSPRLRAVALVGVLVVLLHPAWVLHHARYDGASVASGVELWRHGVATVVVVDGRADPVRALEGLRRAGVRRIDLLVARSGGQAAGDVVRAFDRRYSIGARWAPVDHELRGATTPDVGATVGVGPFVVTVEANDPAIALRVARGP